MKTGKLYAIGVGPGDPELLTIKGKKILEMVPCVCVPKGREESDSLALSIVSQIVDMKGKVILEAFFPMKKTRSATDGPILDAKWNETVKAIAERLKEGADVAFITIGDPALYSTFFYLYDRLVEAVPGLDTEIVPGVSSINAAALRAKIPLGLGNEKIAVLPAVYMRNLRAALRRFDTVVLMKVHRVFGKVLQALNELGLAEKAVYVEKAGMADERIVRDITTLREEEMSYFSMVIVRK